MFAPSSIRLAHLPRLFISLLFLFSLFSAHLSTADAGAPDDRSSFVCGAPDDRS